MEKEQERRHDRGTVKVDSRWGSNVRPRYIDSHSRSLLVLPSFSLAFHLSQFSLPARHSRSRSYKAAQRDATAERTRERFSLARRHPLSASLRERDAWYRACSTRGIARSANFQRLSISRLPRKKERQTYVISIIIPPGIRPDFDSERIYNFSITFLPWQ